MTASVAERIRSRVEHVNRARLREWGGHHPLVGRQPALGDIPLNSNDYLAIGADPRIASALHAAPTSADHGATAALEAEFAAYLGAPAAVLCQSGWEANVGLLQTIVDCDTPVYVDGSAHMSLAFGARAAGATVVAFPHNDVDALRCRIAACGPGIVAVDAIDSTAGSRAQIERLCELAEHTGSVLVVDESHTLGVDGPRGAGMVAALDLADRVAFRTASLAKAFAGRAGVVACDPDIADCFRLASYPAVFSSAVPARDIAALRAALAVIGSAESRRARLRVVGSRIRLAMSASGFELAGDAGHIVPLPTGPARHAIAVREFLEQRGVLGSVFFPPAVPGAGTLIRLSLHAALTDPQVDRIVAACTGVANTFGPIPPAQHPSQLISS
ncbi:aminotransferase class I/II-fold pyridoxal phosphate-dependent enzyme [Nocardia alba]|uniref:8-amino-7-oxononanoate synthase n=1 Tax=Nocardia alba TaxID=225051 RepID=A0A4R1FXK2_9NOCA|nr:aminotransferase class I/II-fold pyridoxal phosphate-dependent enzyme [Nocardia alba]TCJ97528.1 CAI-1 autoinducer synthase [Nocardia alba]